MTTERLAPVPPGAILLEEFMKPLGLSARALARELGIPPNRVTSILNGTRAVTAATAIMLGKRFGMSPEFWMGLQVAHDLEVAGHVRAVPISEAIEDARLNRIADERLAAGEEPVALTLDELRARRGKAHHPSELPEHLKAAVGTARMDPKHDHLDRLMDEEEG